MNEPIIEALQQRIDALEAREARRRRRWLASFSGVAVMAALWGFGSWGAAFDCSAAGPLPFGLNCLMPNTPAVANELNHNFNALSTQIGALNLAVNGDGGVQSGLVKQHIVTGAALNPPTCGQTAATPCVVPLTGFTAQPICVVSAINPGFSGVTDTEVIVGTSATSLSVWKGQYSGGGTNVIFNYICVGY